MAAYWLGMQLRARQGASGVGSQSVSQSVSQLKSSAANFFARP